MPSLCGLKKPHDLVMLLKSCFFPVPHNGHYLIHARVYGEDKYSRHYLTVDGVQLTYVTAVDDIYEFQSSSTSIVMHLFKGQQVAVDPNFSSTVRGGSPKMYTSFGVTLLYPD